MSAGTERFVIEYVQIGDLGIIGSFPHCDRLPRGAEGIDELAEELQKHDITSKKDIAAFISWILDKVLPSTRCTVKLTYIITHALDEFYRDDYFSTEEEEEEDEDEDGAKEE